MFFAGLCVVKLSCYCVLVFVSLVVLQVFLFCEFRPSLFKVMFGCLL